MAGCLFWKTSLVRDKEKGREISRPFFDFFIVIRGVLCYNWITAVPCRPCVPRDCVKNKHEKSPLCLGVGLISERCSLEKTLHYIGYCTIVFCEMQGVNQKKCGYLSGILFIICFWKGDLYMSESNGLRDDYRRPTLWKRMLGVYENYFRELEASGRVVSDEELAEELLSDIQTMIRQANAGCAKGDTRERMAHSLPIGIIARCLLKRHRFANIDYTGDDRGGSNSTLGMYLESGPYWGTYTISDQVIGQAIRRFDANISRADMGAVTDILREESPTVMPCSDPNLVAVNNGIFDDARKELLPFTPDLVFVSKICWDYDPGATDVAIPEPDGGVWSVDTWFGSVNSDPEAVRFLWQVLGMLVRPNKPWNKIIFLYSEAGNNGKGTFCKLAKNLIGRGNYAGLKLSDFDRQFMLAPLMYTQAVIADENDVGDFLSHVGNLKAIATGDSLQIDRKYKDPVTIQFRGVILECLNGMPQVRDQSESFLRRLIFVLMDQNFEGREKKYIKEDFLGRPEVLKYVLKKLLEMDLDENDLQVPKRSQGLRDEYREFNDPVYAFWTTFEPEFVWDLLPYQFLYDLYKKWFDKMYPRGKVVSYRKFLQNVKSAARSTGWFCDERDQKTWSANRMVEPERLIIDWDLDDWMNGTYSGNDWKLKAGFKQKQTYRGVHKTA